MFSVSLQTLGCKLNQLESESLAAAFRKAGAAALSFADGSAPGTVRERPDSPPREGPAPLLVLNTCTVTSKAEQKARRVIRKTLRENPQACVIVTGCYAQMEAAAVADLDRDLVPPGRLFVVPGSLKSALLDLPAFLAEGAQAGRSLREMLSQWTRLPPSPAPQDPFRFSPDQFSFHSRAFLKIQDGCNKRCAYCRVSLARGPSTSLGAEQARSRLRALEAAGYGEAVLTGVNIGQYQDGGRCLGALLEYLLEGTSSIALRLSSIEPEMSEAPGLYARFFRVLENPRIRPHFHLSVQSGSRRVLERMGRSYTPQDVEEFAARLRAVKEDPFLACDIIAGFPGEGAGDFEETLDLCRRLDFAWIHPFPYSPRPGTAAYTHRGKVPQRTATDRVEALLDLARRGRRDYLGRWTGKTVEALLEGGQDPFPQAALSANYLRLLISPPRPCDPAPPFPRPGAIRCRIIAGEGPSPAGGPAPWGSAAPLRFDAWAERIFP